MIEMDIYVKKKKKKSDPSSQFNWPPLGNVSDLEKFI